MSFYLDCYSRTIGHQAQLVHWDWTGVGPPKRDEAYGGTLGMVAKEAPGKLALLLNSLSHGACGALTFQLGPISTLVELTQDVGRDTQHHSKSRNLNGRRNCFRGR